MKKKVAFIICTNDEQYMSECSYYINRIYVPDGFEIEILTKNGAKSMCAGYNEMMRASDAEYKVYMHQDTFILNRYFIFHMMNIFNADKAIGMIGMVGYTKASDCGVMWKSTGRVGTVPMYGAGKQYKNVDLSDYESESVEYIEVDEVDGFLMATDRDISWDEDTFDGWDFYDADQSFSFRKEGYKVVVPVQNKPWCVHDDGGYLTLWNYNKYRKRFLEKYAETELMKNQELIGNEEGNSIIATLEANEKYAEKNREIIKEMVDAMDEAVVKSDMKYIKVILESIKSDKFILSGKSAKVTRMIGAFGQLGRVDGFSEFTEKYNSLVFALRRIETADDYDLFSQLIKSEVGPGAVISVLEKEYFERDEYICERIITNQSLFKDDVERLTWLIALGNKYPTDTICIETASVLMDYNEYVQALKWLEKISDPSDEISEVINELRAALG